MTALAALLVSITPAAPARAACVAARTVPSVATLPEAWQAAVNALIRSTAEPGHPWSCAGGTIDVQLDGNGGMLVVAREGEEAARRQVASPDDVLPLGQALLATPITQPGDAGERPGSAPPPEPNPRPEPAAAHPESASAKPAERSPAPTSPSKSARRLLLSGGVDARGVGGSNVAWIGPTLSAGVLLGRWLPSISLRQQSAILFDGPSIDELSVALAVQSRFEVSVFELRAGLALRGAVVQRDLPRRRGEQSRLEGRIGPVISFAIPVLPWANVVLSADADFVAVSRETAEPTASSGDQTPTTFPTYTLGGSACFEVPL